MLRTVTLLGFLTGILLLVGYLIAGIEGMTFFLFIASLMNFLSYWYSDKIVLGMYKAKEIKESQNPELHKIVGNLAKKAKIPKPRLYLVNLNVPNSFATGRSPKHSAIAVTTGLLNNLNEKEIEGVLSHEIGHIKNHDILTSTIAATIGGAIAYIAQIAWWSLFLGERRQGNVVLLPLLILAPFAATLVRLAISRTREYKADYTGAVITKKPLYLASALEKISKITKKHPLVGNTATSHLWIVNPFKSDMFANLFNTHPPVEKRVERLKILAKNL